MGADEEVVMGGCCMVGLPWDTVFQRHSGQVLLFFGPGGAQDESSWRTKGKENPPQPRLSSAEPHEGGLQPFLFKIGAM